MVDGMGDGTRAAATAASVHHELPHHRARTFGQPVRAGCRAGQHEGRRFCNELDQPALALADQPGKTATSSSTASWPAGSRRGRTSFPPHRAWHMPTFPTIGATGPTSARKPRVSTHLPAGCGWNLKRCTLQRTESKRGSRWTGLRELRSASLHSWRSVRCGRGSSTTRADWPWTGNIAYWGRVIAPIAGLYAVGSTGQGGLLLKGHGHHLAWAFVSGRVPAVFARDGDAGHS